MQSAVASLASGMVFGSGLTLSGVASPKVIVDQFKLQDFHMLITFLTASASSAGLIALYNHKAESDRQLPTKPESTLGWVGKYDGNLIGGAMIGLGMSLTGACPGTVLVQAAAGIGSSRLLTFSSILAGVAFVKWKQTHPSSRSHRPSTVMQATGWSVKKTVFTYESAMLGAVTLALSLAPRNGSALHPVIGGILITIGQVMSILTLQKPVGVSSAYEDLGKIVCDAADGKDTKMEIPGSIVFAVGIIAGTALTLFNKPDITMNMTQRTPSTLAIAVGGFLLTFGARLAGGCTSGHGISGMAAMSLSSFVTVAAMLGTGIVSTLLFL